MIINFTIKFFIKVFRIGLLLMFLSFYSLISNWASLNNSKIFNFDNQSLVI